MPDQDPIEGQPPNDEEPRDPREEIHRNLVRNVITEPLHSEIRRKPGDLFNIIVDVNLQYYQGRSAAFDEVKTLAEKALGASRPPGATPPESVGSRANPYMAGLMPGSAVQEMVRLDAERIASRKADAEKAAGQPKPPAASHAYRAIYRIWKNFPVRPLIDRSICTVKADAARRAFSAEGRDIVWAVIDSGVDKLHEHFKDADTLDVKLPLKHYDFTVPNGEGADSALVDRFGHGSHVAGIIAGGVLNPRPLRAVRTRMDPQTLNVVEESQEMTAITGMAPCCKILSMKILDDRGQGDVARIIAALDTIQQINDHGRQLLIHGVNLSLGYEFDPRWFACGQSPICTEVNRLVRSGVVVVVAAGNTGYGTLSSKQRATGAGFMLTINDPGNAELAITVGSTHRDMPHVYGVSYFSSKGPTGDGRPKPDLLAPGERILSCQSSGAKNAAGAINSYIEDTGTSMAAPHVSGVIAAFLSIRREFIGHPEEVKQLFLNSATDLKRERAFQGYGLVDLMRAIQSV